MDASRGEGILGRQWAEVQRPELGGSDEFRVVVYAKVARADAKRFGDLAMRHPQACESEDLGAEFGSGGMGRAAYEFGSARRRGCGIDM